MAAEDDILKQPWFWGPIDKEEAFKILMEREHGHFLVRDSATPGDYTLVVRKRGRVRNIRIQRGPRGYGLDSGNCDFRSVADLIDYLLNNRGILRRLFPNLDLVEPVCKPVDDKADGPNTYELLTQLVATNEQCLLQRRAYESHLKEKESTDKEVQQCKTRVRSFVTVLSMFEEQLALQSALVSGTNMKPADEADTPDEIQLTRNRDKTLGRLKMLRGKLDEEVTNVRTLEDKTKRQMEELYLHKMLLAQHDKDIFTVRLAVEDCGIDPKYLDLLLREETESDLSRYNEENWMVPWSNAEAVDNLAGTVPGTFLVRPSRQGGYALSIVCDIEDFTEARHCLIYQSPKSGRYGFHAEYCIFNTIKELVIKHRDISLKHYNSALDVCLTYPINYIDRDT